MMLRVEIIELGAEILLSDEQKKSADTRYEEALRTVRQYTSQPTSSLFWSRLLRVLSIGIFIALVLLGVGIVFLR